MDNSENTHRKRTQRDYTLGSKLQVVASVEKGDMTYKQAQRIYGIQGRSTVLTWLRIVKGFRPLEGKAPDIKYTLATKGA